MRSRYTAFVHQDEAHLLASWHPATRPPTVAVGVQEWLDLRILDRVDGGRDDDNGIVEFEARFRDVDDQVRVLHERSTFIKDGGRWFYVGAEDASVR